MAKRKIDVVSSEQDAGDRAGKKSKASSTRKANSNAVVNHPNSLSREEFQNQYLEPTWLIYLTPSKITASVEGTDEAAKVQLTFKRSADMRPDETTACLDLVRETSKDDYEQSKSMGGWSDHRKRRELRDKDMRFLLLRRGALRQPSNKSSLPVPPSKSVNEERVQGEAGNEAGNEAGIEGFLSFMIDHDSSPRVPVLYIYEIHLKEAMRGQGVGGHTLKVAEGIGAKVGVKKLMLTCLMCNGKARKVYEKFGFALDATSPEEKAMRGRKSKIDHVIMSKNVEGD